MLSIISCHNETRTSFLLRVLELCSTLTPCSYNQYFQYYPLFQFNIIVCDTIDGNNDVIIGDAEMKMENYCN